MLKFLVILLFTTYLCADETRRGHWLANVARVNLNQDYFQHLEAHLRYDHELGQTYQTLVNYGVMQRKSKNEYIGVLYGMLQGLHDKNEHRLSLHYSKRAQLKNVSYSLRLRLEQRTLEKTALTPTDRDSQRIRIFNRFDNISFLPKNLVLWDELFFNPNQGDWSDNALFDRNWFFLGFRFNYFNKSANIGYLNQYIPRKDEIFYEHMLVLALFI